MVDDNPRGLPWASEKIERGGLDLTVTISPQRVRAGHLDGIEFGAISWSSCYQIKAVYR